MLISNDLPKGWFRAGDHPENYQMGVDSTIFYGEALLLRIACFIKSLPTANDDGFGTLMQDFFPKDFLGKRVRLSGYVKHNNITGWAGMWMRVDIMNSDSVLDNMQNRKIKGTGNWKKFENVLDVPDNATKLAFGILLSGEGEAWLDECKFEIVDPTQVPVTVERQEHPMNLSF